MIQSQLFLLKENGPHLRNEHTTENWAYGHFYTQNLELINMDVSGGYDQISRQVWACVCKFLN